MQIELNRDTAKRYANVLLEANEAWFYGYHWTAEDQARLTQAMAFFVHVEKEQGKKAKEVQNG